MNTMTIDELSKRFDDELAQIDARIDDHHNDALATVRQQTANFYAFADPIKEDIHDLKNAIKGLKTRIESLEAYPPDFTIGEPPDTPDPSAPAE